MHIAGVISNDKRLQVAGNIGSLNGVLFQNDRTEVEEELLELNKVWYKEFVKDLCTRG